MKWGALCLDVFAYVGVVTALLVPLTFAPITALIVASPLVFRGACRIQTDERWFNPFEVVKLAEVLLAVATLVGMQTHLVPLEPRLLHGLLLVNVGTAVACDALVHGLHGVPNVLAGILVMRHTPIKQTYLHPTNGALYVSTPYPWIALYSVWNAAFAYGFGYSHTTRLVLVPPVLLCICLSSPDIWIVPRSWSMLVNMSLRASESFWVYRPGSLLTKRPQEQPPKPTRVLACGLFALLCALLFVGLEKF